MLFAAFAVFVGSQLVSSVRLNQFFNQIGLNLGFVENLRLYFLGMFYNLFLPGGIGGDGYKIYVLRKKFDISVKKLLGAIFNDRLSGMVAIVILVFTLFYFVPIEFRFKPLIFSILILAPVGYNVLLFIFFKQFRPIWVKVLALATSIQSLQLISAWLILLALGGSNDFASYLMLFLISSLVSIIPITVGGVGAREMVFLYGAQFLGLQVDQCVALSLMFYFISVIASAFGGLYVFKPIEFSDMVQNEKALSND